MDESKGEMGGVNGIRGQPTGTPGSTTGGRLPGAQAVQPPFSYSKPLHRVRRHWICAPKLLYKTGQVRDEENCLAAI